MAGIGEYEFYINPNLTEDERKLVSSRIKNAKATMRTQQRFNDTEAILKDGTKIKLFTTASAASYTINGGLPYLQGYSTLDIDWADIVEACNG